MKSTLSQILIHKPGLLHFLCCTIALLGTVPLLWRDLGSGEIQETITAYAGVTIVCAFAASLLTMLASCLYLVLHLHNLRALGRMCLWALQWLLCWAAFCLFAILANVQPRHEMENPDPIQQTDTLFAPVEQLTGPEALSITILPETAQSETLENTPNLTLLENEHEEILEQYLSKAPRWAGEHIDATFYARPGHAVAGAFGSGPNLGLVHVAFLTLVEGEQLPVGYEILKPGAPFPSPEGEHADTPDIALELGHRQYLLLAWRGAEHGETARKAINATISAVDEQFAQLAKTPTEESIARMLQGKRSTTGNTPELRLCEAPTQYGTYQAEIYVNPGKAGTLLLLVKDLESGQSLRLFNCPAYFSENDNELFRHDIPGSIPAWMREVVMASEAGKAFPAHSPIFAIKCGETHRYFGVAFEVWFYPEDNSEPRRLLLRRCYKVQAYENTPEAPANHPPHVEDILQDDNTQGE